jgi:hypothetical protein
VTTETFGFSGCIPQCDCHNARYSEINYRFPQLTYQVWEAFCCKHNVTDFIVGVDQYMFLAIQGVHKSWADVVHFF